jgi:hypothetical protein
MLAGLTPLTDLIDGDREGALAPSKSRLSPLSALIPSTARETVIQAEKQDNAYHLIAGTSLAVSGV